MSKTYRIAIIGVGGIAAMHANAAKDLDNAQLVAGSCRTEKKGREFADKFDCKWFSDYEAMLDETKPDVVTIATPSGFHLEPVTACAKRGMHVLCEKPIEITTERIDQMIKIADDAGITLGGIFPSRYSELNNLIRDTVAAGRFGRLSMGATYVPWWRDDAYYAPERWQGTVALDGGGALMNQSIHGVDTLQWIMAAGIDGLAVDENPVEEVVAFTGRCAHDDDLMEVEDTAVACLKFKNGALGQILGATSMYPGNNRRTIIAGRDGTAIVEENELVSYAFRDEKPEDKHLLEKYRAKTDAGGTGASDPLAIGHGGHTNNLRSFLEALDSGKRPTIDAVQSRKAVAIIQAIYASAASGKTVKVG
jgi:predicted dehydrogenase